MLKTTYRYLILPYTVLLLYFMFLGFGRTQLDDNILRVTPIVSTFLFIKQCLLYSAYSSLIINLIGNIVMFMPFGGLGLIFPKLQSYHNLIMYFLTSIFVIESFQYFSRMGVFDIDDILFNTVGVSLGYLISKRLRLF